MASADLVLDGVQKVAVGLARRLVTIDEGEAATVEALMVEIIDPIYTAASMPDPMMRMLFFCEDIRSVTGLPVRPRLPAL